MLVCSLCQKSQFYINAYFAVAVWMLNVITHIQKYAKDHSVSDHSKQVNNRTKTLFHGLSVDKMAVTQYLICTDYTFFDNKNG